MVERPGLEPSTQSPIFLPCFLISHFRVFGSTEFLLSMTGSLRRHHVHDRACHHDYKNIEAWSHPLSINGFFYEFAKSIDFILNLDCIPIHWILNMEVGCRRIHWTTAGQLLHNHLIGNEDLLLQFTHKFLNKIIIRSHAWRQTFPCHNCFTMMFSCCGCFSKASSLIRQS